jgi:hypothetical protein
MLRAMPIALRDLAARVPRRWRRRVPMRLRNALVERFGHPTGPFDPTTRPRRLDHGGNRLRFSTAEALAVPDDPRDLALRFSDAVVRSVAPAAAT